MPDEYEDMKRALQGWRKLRWIHLFMLLRSLSFMFVFLCLTEWNTFRLCGFELGMAASVRVFGQTALYGIVMVPCVTVTWMLLLKALTIDSRKAGFRLGMFFRGHADIDRL